MELDELYIHMKLERERLADGSVKDPARLRRLTDEFLERGGRVEPSFAPRLDRHLPDWKARGKRGIDPIATA